MAHDSAPHDSALTPDQERFVSAELSKRKLDLYRPYPRQREFHAYGSSKRERLLLAANQCITPWTFIQMVDSMVRSSEAFFVKGGNVLSWGGVFERVSQISGGFLKGIEPAFRLVMESGHFFDCSATHQILTSRGYQRIDRIMSQTNGLYLLHRDEDYLANCVACGYLDGQQLHLSSNISQEQPPSLSDAQKRNLIFSQEDVEAHKHQYTTTLKEYAHPSTFDHVPSPLLDLFDLFSIAKVKSPSLALSDVHKNVLQLVARSFSLAQSSGESVLCDAVKIFHAGKEPVSFDVASTIEESAWLSQSSLRFPNDQNQDCSVQLLNHGFPHKLIFYPFQSPILVGGGKIVSIVPLGYQPIIDCQVPDVNNYKAAGVYHHNCGKTFCMAAEVSMHATGKYPSYWQGMRFRKAPVIWCAGVTGEVVRDTIQRLLIGDVANPGTGLIPPGDVHDTTPSRGVADLVDTILVKHTSGANTRIRLKYYEQGREKFQADTVDFVWLDEEPDEELYTEALTRTNATKGILGMTFTPLKGMSAVVRRFLNDPSPDRVVVNMTIEDAEHILPEDRIKIIESYPQHERAARTRGEPMLGSGAIFPIADEDIMCDPFPLDSVPFFWQELAALDFGWDHPTAAVRGLYNPQDDILYITNTYKRREATPLVHAAALKPWGNVPFAWPHDGLQHDKGSGTPLKELYRLEGLNMLPENARFEDGSNGVEAGIAEMLMRMQTGRLKIFRHLNEWFEEKRMYHRREGKIWKEYDDLMASTRYLLMCLRFAQRVGKPQGFINGYRIEETMPVDTYNRKDYNPLGHKYINEILGVK